MDAIKYVKAREKICKSLFPNGITNKDDVCVNKSCSECWNEYIYEDE